ncbi:Ig-like domain-containing protein, partial [Campylobacter sp. 9BO]|uniref:Ig-like domain-containing protein n=1 Tax=Campylobacter sp. 9BO TaxID=3424759 RepID=UPI003D32AA79
TAAGTQDEIEVDNRIPTAPDFTFPEDKNKDGTINKDENDNGDGKQNKTTVRVEIPDNVKPGDTIVVETPEGDTIKVPVPEDKDNPGNPPKTVDVPDVPINPDGETLVTVRIDTPNNPGTPNTKPINTDMTPPKPDVEGNNDGSVNVIPETSKDKDGVKTEITYTGKDGKTTTVVYDKQPDGTWKKDPLIDLENKLPNTSTKDGDNEVIKIPSGVVKSGTDVIDITTDDAGNKGDDKDQITDTVKPNTPVITNVIDDQAGGIEGEVDNGKKTNDNKPTIKGDAEPHSTVTIYDNGAPIGTTTADKDGKFEFTPTTPLNDGKHDFTATATDDGGNTSDHSNARDVIVDTVAKIDIKAGNVEIDKDGNFTTKITGTTDVENGQVVTIKDPTNGKETTVIVKDGKFEAVIEYDKDKPVPTTIEASVEDVAGNLAVNDVTPPKAGDLPAPVITNVIDNAKGFKYDAASKTYVSDNQDATNANVTSGGTTNDKTPVVEGTVDSKYDGFTVEIYKDGSTTPVATATVKPDGAFTSNELATALSDGKHTFTAKLVAGSEKSASSNEYGITVDTAAEVSVSIADATPLADGTFTRKVSGSVSNSVEDGQKIVITTADGKTFEAEVSGGRYEVEVKFNNKTSANSNINVQVADQAGNLAVNDVTPPKAGDLPTIEITQMSDDEKGENNATGVIGRDTTGDDTDPQSLEDGLTNDKTPGITGKITPPAGAKVADYEGFTVEIYDGETKVGTTTLKADGTYSIDALKNLKTDGDHALTAKLVAGKESSESAPYNIHVDTTATIGITHIATDVQVGADTGDDISKYKTIKGDTNDHATINNNEIKNFTISGTTTDVEEGQIVTITLTDRDGKQETTTAQVQADGTWRATGVNASTLTGKISVKAEVADKAGNKAQDIDVAAIDAGVKFNDTDIDGKLNVNVSEEGLAGGIKDSSGTSDTTNDAKVTKTITATSDSAVTYTIVTENNTAAKFTAADGSQKALTSGGKAITWYKEGDSLVGKTSDHTEVLKVSLTANGEATVELKGTIDHPGKNIEDAIATTLRVKATNAVGSTAEVDVKVNIEDDSPQIYSSQTSNLKAEFDGNMNITLVVDFSPSMNDKLQTGDTIFDNKNNVEYKMRADGYFYNSANQKLDVTGDGYADKDITRLDATKYELKQMFDSYTDMGGNVKVNIIAFANTAVSITNDKFVDVKTANEAININFTKTIVDSSSSGVKIVTGLDSSGNAITKTNPVNILAQDYNGLGGTNYEAGMAEAIKSFNAAGNNKFTTDATNKLFFITDGSPTASDGDESVLSNAAKGTKVEGNYHDFYLKATYYNNGTATYSIDSGDQVYKYTDTNGKVHLVSQGFTEIYPRYTYTKATVADLNNDADGNIETRYSVYTGTNADELYNSTYTYKDANKTDIHNLSTGELKQWRDFIEKNHIEAKTYYIGNEPITYTDNSITADDKQQPIYKIGWDGTEGVGKGKPIQPQDFKDFGKLEGKTIEGKNLIRSDEDTSDAKFNFGADEIGKVEIVIDGNKFKYDAATNKISVVRVVDNNEVEDITEKYTANIKLDGKLEYISVGSQGSKLSIDMKTGDYSYTPGVKIAAPNGEEKIPVKFTIIDKDGDSSTSTTTLSAHSTQPSLDIRLLSFVDDVKSVVTSNNVTIVERYSASDSIAHEKIDITGGTKNSNVRNYDVGLTNDAQPELKFAVNIPEGGATVKVTIGGKTFNYDFAEKGNSVLTVKVSDLAGDVSLSEANANFSATITAKSSAVAAKLSPVTLNAKVDLDITPDTLDAKVDVNANGDVSLTSASVSDTQTGNSKNTADKLTVTLNDGSVRDVPLINGNVAATLLENGVTADSVYTLTHTDKAGNKTILDKSITVLTPTPISLELSENDMLKVNEHQITAKTGYTYTLKITNENTGLKYIDEQGNKHNVLWQNKDGKFVGVANGVDVIEVSMDTSNKVSAKLLKPVEHDANTGNSTSKLVDGLVLNTSKGAKSVDARVMLTIADDTPEAIGEHIQHLNPAVSITTVPQNVTFVLDMSNSMILNGLHNIDHTRDMIKGKIDEFTKLYGNDVKVSLVIYGNNAIDLGATKGSNTWLTAGEAKTLLDTYYIEKPVTHQGFALQNKAAHDIGIVEGTNFDGALAKTMSVFKDNGKITDGANKIFFMTDGEPRAGNRTPYLTRQELKDKGVTFEGKHYSYVQGGDTTSGANAGTTIMKFRVDGGTRIINFHASNDEFASEPLSAWRLNVWKDGKNIIQPSSITGVYGSDYAKVDPTKKLYVDDLSASQAKEWTDFLKANKIDANAYVLGGSANVASQTMKDIAFNGITGEDKDTKLFSELATDKIVTVSAVSGNIIDHNVEVATGSAAKFDFGIDGAKSVEMTIDGKTYVYDYVTGNVTDKVSGSIIANNSAEISVTTAQGGKLDINMSNGDYKYAPAAAEVDGKANIKIDYAIIDRDGDIERSSTTLALDGGVTKDYSSTTSETLIGSADKYDTMVVKSESIDFTKIVDLDAKVEHLDRIDLGHGYAGKTITLNASDVLEMTDNVDTILKIEGDSKDTIKGNWTKASGTEQSKADAGYSVYEGVTDQGQTIYIQIDQDIKMEFN